MKKLLPILFVTLFTLTGCISQRPETIVLTDENSAITADPREHFEIRLPNEAGLILVEEEGGARLYRVSEKESELTYMYIEETPTDIEQAITLLSNLEQVSEVAREETNIGGLPAKKVLVEIEGQNAEPAAYYFVDAPEMTYVFSLAGGNPWKYYQRVVETFTLTSQE